MSDRKRRVASLTPKQRALLAKRLKAKKTAAGPRTAVAPAAGAHAAGGPPPIPRCGKGEPDVLSFAQERFWFLDRWQPGSPAYNLADVVRITGRLDVAAFGTALREVIRRHRVLRTLYVQGEGLPRPELRQTPEQPLQRVDLTTLPEARREVLAAHLGRREARTPFDLARGPLLRARLLRLGEEQHVLLLNLHHIVSDLWSFGILVHELGEGYRRLVSGDRRALPAPPVQYADFAAWQRERLSGPNLERELEHWRRTLEGAPRVLELPSDRPRPAVMSHRGARHVEILGEALSSRLRSLAQQTRCTPFMVLRAGLEILIHRLLGVEDFLLGSPVAGRTHPQLEGTIGVFVNTLVLRAELSEGPSFRTLLDRVRGSTLDALAHQELPFEALVEALRIERDLSRPALVQVLFAVGNASAGDVALPGLRLVAEEQDSGMAKFDLSLIFADDGERLAGSWTYATDLFDAATVERFAEQLQRLLEGALAQPDRAVAQLPLLSAGERRQLVAWEGERGIPPRFEPLHRRLARWAGELGDAVAVRWTEPSGQGASWSWRELDRRVEHLARRLRAGGIASEERVGIHLGLSPGVLVAMLGIGRAGGAFLVLDPTFPGERLLSMAHEAGVRRVVVDGESDRSDSLAGFEVLALDRLDLDGLEQGIDDTPPAVALPSVGPDHLAYVLYTSGSTGRPKGVMVEHGGLMRYLDWVGETLMTGGPLPLPAVTRPSFDGSYRQLLAPLARGEAVLFPAAESGDPLALAGELRRGEAVGLSAVPSLWSALLLAAESQSENGGVDPLDGRLERLIFGGEAVDQALLDQTFERFGEALEVWNCYGPTEVTVNATAARLRAGEKVHIGGPIAGAEVLVLDRRGRRLPVGAPGQLMVAGPGLARGYLDQPGRTAERFLPHPEGLYPGDRVYATGDRVRWRNDGSLEYLGRLDQQVKLRGFRIELGEIEAHLGRLPGVARGVVDLRRVAGEDRLVAYLVESAPTGDAELVEALGHTLPDFMVPTTFVRLDTLPTTGTGKLDRDALPNPILELSSTEKVPPRGDTEGRLAALFGELLGIEAIGRDDDFFALGGHSLLAVRLLAGVRTALGVELSMRVPFEAPTVATLAERIEAARGDGPGSTGDDGASTGSVLPAIVPVPRTEALPLSFSQERLWFLDQLAPGSPVYNIAGALRLKGGLEPEALRAALAAVIERHEVLRTVYRMDAGRPLQVILDDPPLRFEVVDLGSLPREERESAARRRASELAETSFDLAAEPPLRFRLLVLDDGDHIFAFALHHILADGWSLGLMLRGIADHLEGHGLETPPVQYADFAHWQRRHFEDQHLAGQLAYWRQRLAGAPALLELPTDRPRPPVQTFRGERLPVRFDPELLPRLETLGQATGATLFMVLTAGLGSLLHRLSGADDLVVGSPIAGRHHPGVEPLIGFFVNNLALRLGFEARTTFADAVARARDAALGAYAHQDVPFERLVEEVNPERRLAHFPVFQVVLALQQSAWELPPAPPGLELEPLAVETTTAKVDLELHLWDDAGRLAGEVIYCSDLFDHSTVERWMGHLGVLLEAAVAEPGRPVADLALLGAVERDEILTLGRGSTTLAEPSAEDEAGWVAPRRIARLAAERPGALAVSAPDGTLTYGELEERAGELGRRLAALGVGPEILVALCLPRGLSLVPLLYGIWKAGGAYLPLDETYPEQRLRFLLEDSGARVLITDEAHREALAGEGWRTLVVADDGTVRAEEGHATGGVGGELSLPEPDHLAYVIYTSGSTGKPKGVLLPHTALSRYIAWHRRALAAGPGTRGSQITSPGFDASVAEIWAHLAVGGSVHLADEATRRTPELLRDWMVAEQVEISLMPAPLAEGVLALDWPDDAALRFLLSGGDRLRRHAPAWIPFTLLNNYGPTETTILVTSGPVGVDGAQGYPDIGRAIDHAEALVVGPDLELQPIGVAGELLIGGRSLARGYLGRPALSAERFVPHPWGRRPGARLYRTGDRVRWLADGTIDFLGRIDHQIQLRGIRIEPGEIEAALADHPGVAEAALAVRGEESGDLRLDAYFVARPGAEPTTETLRSWLAERLPSAMLPSSINALDALPLDVHGKVSRKALPPPEALAAVSEGTLRPPRNPAEELLVGIWCEVLGLDALGIDQDFFELGGHSLLATQITSRVRGVFGAELSLQALFEAPTVEALARRLTTATGGGLAPSLVPRPRGGGLASLSFAQERLWFLDRLEPGSSAYNIPLALGVRGGLDAGALAMALVTVMRRHEVLRTVFALKDGVPRQIVRPMAAEGLARIDLRALPTECREHETRRLRLAMAARPFALERDAMLRALLVHLGEDEDEIVLVLHHIAGDGWSFGLLVQELEAGYRAAVEGTFPGMPPLALQYADFAVWQRGWLRGEVLDRHLAWWRRELEELPAVLDLPWDRPPTEGPRRAGYRSLALAAPIRWRLEALCHERRSTPFMVLLAAFQGFLHRIAQQDDVAVGTPVAGRDRLETEGLIGFFVNTLVLRSRLVEGDGGPSFRDLLDRSRRRTLAAFGHQEVPFEKLVEVIRPKRQRNHNPFFQAFFSLATVAPPTLDLPGLDFEPRTIDAPETKFDLVLRLAEAGEGFEGELVYAADRLDPSTADRLATMFLRFVEGAVAEPGRPVAELPLMGVGEERQVLGEWAVATEPMAEPPAPTLHGWVVDRLMEAPGARALVELPRQPGEAARSWTRGQLDRWSRQLAGRLRHQGVGPEVTVGLWAERSAEMVVGMLAILRAGGVFVPLDPEHPRQHLESILDVARPAVILAQPALVPRLDADTPFVDNSEAAREPRLLTIDPPTDGPTDGRAAEADLPGHRSANLAYLVSTSGSTGRPKAVMATHRAIVRHLAARQGLHPLGDDDRLLQQAPMSFEMAIWEIFWPLVTGAELVLSPPGSERDPETLVRLVAEEGITALRFTPSMLALVLERRGLSRCRRLRHVFTGAESLSWSLVERHAQGLPGQLHHLYGPTETCVTASLFTGERRAHHPKVPIGTALGGAKLVVVDRRLRPLPPGVAGELLIGGPGLARGYRRAPGQTAERFVPDPWGEPGERLYRSGDRVRWLRDGQLDFLGRIDRQVKVRGIRVELEHVESVLSGLPGVREAALLHDPTAGGRLLAWIAGDADEAELRSILRGRLPEVMVPSIFGRLEALPRTRNGKVDRRALSGLGTSGAGEAGGAVRSVAPADALEAELLEIWRQILEREDFGVEESFFDLGGHSLLAVRLVDRVERRLGRSLPLAHLFDADTIRRQAAVLHRGDDRQEQGGPPTVVTLRRGDDASPLVLIHPVGGQVFCYRALARAFDQRGRESGAGPALWALPAPRVAVGDRPSIEELAACHLETLRARGVSEALRLAGWSMGAVVAWEMAHQLRSGGEDVELLALFDPPPAGWSESAERSPLDQLLAFGRDLVALGRGAELGRVLEEIEPMEVLAALESSADDPGPIDGVDLRPYRAHFTLFRSNAAALAAYRPTPREPGMPGQEPAIDLVLAERSAGPEEIERWGPARGWDAASPGPIAIHSLPGGHYDLLRSPNVEQVAELLADRLASGRAEGPRDQPSETAVVTP